MSALLAIEPWSEHRLKPNGARDGTSTDSVSSSGRLKLVEDPSTLLECERAVLLVTSCRSAEHTDCVRRFAETAANWDPKTPMVFAEIRFDVPEGQRWLSTMQWWEEHDLPQGGYKDWGCQGGVVWLEYGIPVAHRFCRSVTSENLASITRETFVD